VGREAGPLLALWKAQGTASSIASALAVTAPVSDTVSPFRVPRRWSCGKRAARPGSGDGWSTIAPRRAAGVRCAQLSTPPKPRKCAECRKTFTLQRSDAKTCGSACRQALYRRHISSVSAEFPFRTKGGNFLAGGLGKIIQISNDRVTLQP
jgi:hypothetical protein